jgi:hypothetical protein
MRDLYNHLDLKDGKNRAGKKRKAPSTPSQHASPNHHSAAASPSFIARPLFCPLPTRHADLTAIQWININAESRYSPDSTCSEFGVFAREKNDVSDENPAQRLGFRSWLSQVNT